jgi:UDP-N-acetylglucosamine--N-acetylmuramyl-(pentapeptide) pyrophosphoryl-undecaprenol N-acetylglucosamine transferase
MSAESATRATVVLAAGGTGGHVFPAQAVADALKARGYAVALVTDERGGDLHHRFPGVDVHRVKAGGIAGKSVLARIRSVVALGFGTLAARGILKRLRPACVVGFGGYASIPAVMAALGRYPTVIHEQNAVLGRANRLLAARADRIATAFAEVRALNEADRAKAVQVGMPVRPEIAAARATPFDAPGADGPLRILVLGGSQGARVFSDVIPAAVAKLDPALRARLVLMQQCRPEDLDRVGEAYAAIGATVDLAPFFDDVPERLGRTHLVIARAGASTVAEVIAVGRPAILVPYPYAVDDHQDANAHAVADSGAGWLMPEPSFTPDSLSERLTALLARPSLLEPMAQGAFAAGVTDAADKLADVVESLIPDRRAAA